MAPSPPEAKGCQLNISSLVQQPVSSLLDASQRVGPKPVAPLDESYNFDEWCFDMEDDCSQTPSRRVCSGNPSANS